MNTDRDKYLTEAMDKKWYDPNGMTFKQFMWKYGYGMNTDFSTFNGLGELKVFLVNKNLWIPFIDSIRPVNTFASKDELLIHESFFNPDRFAYAIYEFLKGREQ